MSNLNNDGSEFRKLWDKAWQQYVRDLPPKVRDKLDLKHPRWLNIKNVDDLASMIESEHKQFDKDTSRGSTVSEIVKGAFGGLNRIIDIIGGAAGAAFPPCSQALGAVKVLIDSGLQVSKSFDALSGMFDKIGGFLKRLGPLSTNKIDPPLEEILRQLLICMLNISLLATKRACSYDGTAEELDGFGKHFQEAWQKTKSKTKQYSRQLFEGGDKEITTALSQLESLVDAEVKMTGALVKKDTTEIKQISLNIQQLSIQIGDDIFEMRRTIFEIAQGVQFVDARLVDVQASQAQLVAGQKKQNKEIPDKVIEGVSQLINDALKPPDNRSSGKLAEKTKEQSQLLNDALKPPEGNQIELEKLNRERLPGTGDWLIEDDVVKRWMTSKVPVLIVTATKGSGNTYLASRVVKELAVTINNSVQGHTSSYAYFFCRRNAKHLSSIPRLLRSVAFQIAQNDTVYANHVHSKRDQITLGEEDTQIKPLWKALFHDFFSVTGKSSSSAWVVLDGVDECDGNSIAGLLQAIKELSVDEAGWQLPTFHLLMHVTSDSESTFKAALLPTAEFLVLDQSRSRGDVKIFIEHKMSVAWKKSLVSKRLRENVVQALLQQPHCNFQWVSLVLKEVFALSREEDMLVLLSEPPADVAEAIINVLTRLKRRLDDHGREDLNAMLSWITSSQINLTLAQLDALLTVRSSKGARVINLEDLVRNDYAALFVVYMAEGLAAGPTDDKIRLRLRLTALESTEPGVGNSRVEANASSQIDIEKDRKEFANEHILEDAEKVAAMQTLTIRLVNDLESQLETKSHIAATEPEQRPANSQIGLTRQEMHRQTLLDCLRVICDEAEDELSGTLAIARNYCAIYLPEHLQQVELAAVDSAFKSVVQRRLIGLLRNEASIDRWVEIAGPYMTYDLLRSDTMRKTLVSWLSDLDPMLTEDDPTWTTKIIERPVETLFLRVAQGHARRWLQKDDTGFHAHFDFISTYMEITTGPPKDDEAVWRYYTFDGSSDEEITRAAEWAGLEQNALWCRRVASSFWTGAKYNSAISMYERALSLDESDTNIYEGLFFVYWLASQEDGADHESLQPKAIENLNLSIERYKSRMSDTALSSDERRQARIWYANRLINRAQVHTSMDEKENSIEAYRDLLNGWEESEDMPEVDAIIQTGASEYIGILYRLDMHDKAIEVWERCVRHKRSQSDIFKIWYRLGIDNADVLLQLAYKTTRFDLLDEFWRKAAPVVARNGDDGMMAAVRWYHAQAILRLAPHRRADAITLLKGNTEDNEIATPTQRWYWIRSVTTRELAQIYSIDALEARDRDRWTEVSRNVEQLRKLAHIDSDDRLGYRASTAALLLAAWNRMNGRRERAKLCAKAMLKQSLDMLYDYDAGNDYKAWLNIAEAMLLVGDVERSKTAYGVCGADMIFENNTEIVDFDMESEASEDEGDADEDLDEEGEEEGEEMAMDTNGAAPDAAGKEITETSSVPGVTAVDTDTPAEDAASERIKDPSSSPEDDTNGGAAEEPRGNGEPADVESQIEDEIPTTATATGTSNSDTHTSSAEPTVATGIVEPLPTEAVLPNGTVTDPPIDEEARTPSIAAPTSTSWMTCDGPCFERITYDQPVWRCGYCITYLCEACMILIRDGRNTRFDICSTAHEWYEMPPTVPMKAKTIVYKEKEMDVQEWLDGLAKAYHIPRVKFE